MNYNKVEFQQSILSIGNSALMTYNTMKLIVKTFRIALICFIHSLTEVHRVR